jgi:hypothetical protein
VNILVLEITAAGGKVNWMNIRRFLYVALGTWLIGVRLIGLNPFDDKELTLATLLDALGLYAVWLILWHAIWSVRPKFG